MRRLRGSFSRLFMPGSVRVRLFASIALWTVVAYYFLKVFNQVDWLIVISRPVHAMPAVFVLVIGVGSRFVLPLIWTTALSALEEKPMQVRVLLWPYAVSWISRYIPGQVGLIGARLLAAERYGYSKFNAIISGGFEVVLQLILVTALGIGLLSVGLGSRLPFSTLPIVIIVAGLAILISPPVLRRIVNLYLRLQRKTEAAVPSLSSRTVLTCAGLLLVMYGLQSSYSILLAEAIGLSVRGQWILFLGAIFFSSVAGTLAFFSPSGIGVRELVFVQLLGSWYAQEQLLSFVIFWRLAETLMDAIFFMSAWLLRPRVARPF
jgi:hypothetical protein